MRSGLSALVANVINTLLHILHAMQQRGGCWQLEDEERMGAQLLRVIKAANNFGTCCERIR
jgi:hypothetical protein